MCVMYARLLLFTGLFVLTFIGTDGDCALPPHPAHGRHQPLGGDCGGANQHPACDGTPGTLAPKDWLLTVRCDPGYQHYDRSAADVPSVCSNEGWSIPQLPTCKLPGDLVTYDRERCTIPEPPPNSQYRLLAEECGGEKLPPGSAVPHDCILFLNCKQGYRRKQSTGDLLTYCANKTWNPNIPNDLCMKAADTTIPTPHPTSVTPSGAQSETCLLPNDSSTRKFCMVTEGCKDCDFYHKRCHFPSGSSVDTKTVVKTVCAPEYTADSNEIAVCVSGGWYNPFPKCKKLCPPLMSNSLRLTCIYGNDEVSCSKHSLPGTKVRFQCLPTFSEDSKKKRQWEYRKSIFCNQSGEWSRALPQCKAAACGMSQIVTLTPTIVGGKESYVMFFPWHAGLYYSEKKDENIWVQKCGGTLINDQVILTAAHCVNNVTQPSDLRVALGKYYRSWDHYETTEVKRNVSAIVYPKEYRDTVYPFDLALVLMSQKVTFSEAIMPACRDHREGIDHLVRTTLYVVGWGWTGLNGPSSEHLLYNNVNYVTEELCKKTLPTYYHPFDKICAVTNNSVSITQKGDSGGGLTAVYEDGLHYVVGVISSKAANISHLSPNLEVSRFTNIKWKTHIKWIDSKLVEFEKTHNF